MPTLTTTLLRTEGNVIYMHMAPATHIESIDSYSDNATGEAGSVLFNRSFRYSKNGIQWTDWQPLTTPAITGIVVDLSDILCIELAFEKVQPAGTDFLSVSNAEIEITVDEDVPDGKYYNASIFSNYFKSTDSRVLGWQLSVLQKLFEPGTIPKFVSRYNYDNSPEDFISFFGSITKFFSFYVNYARQVKDFRNNEAFLREYLRQRGLKTSNTDSLEQLQKLMKSYFKQISLRGTGNVIKEGVDGSYDGELLRSIYYNPTDEFMFNIFKSEDIGVCLDRASTECRSLYLQDNLNKAYETGFDVVDITKYPTSGDVTKITDGDHTVIHIEGAGGIDTTDLKYIKVDPSIDYEISFLIKKSAGNNLTFKCHVYDKDDNEISCKSAADGSDTITFLEEADLVRDDKYILIRGIIYNSNLTPQAGQTMELNQGINLILPANAKKIIPEIVITGGEANIYGLRILPLATPYSRGLTQTNDVISLWMRNHNHENTFEQAVEFIKRYLFNNESHVLAINLNDGYGVSEFAPTTTTTTTSAICSTCPDFTTGTLYTDGSGNYFADFNFDMSEGFGCPFKIQLSVHYSNSAVITFPVVVSSLSDFTSHVGDIYTKKITIPTYGYTPDTLDYEINLLSGFECGISGTLELSTTTTTSTTAAPTTTSTTAAPTTTTTTTVCSGATFTDPLYQGTSGSDKVLFLQANLGSSCNTYTYTYQQLNTGYNTGVADTGSGSGTITGIGFKNFIINPNRDFVGYVNDGSLQYQLVITNCCGVVTTHNL